MRLLALNSVLIGSVLLVATHVGSAQEMNDAPAEKTVERPEGNAPPTKKVRPPKKVYSDPPGPYLVLGAGLILFGILAPASSAAALVLRLRSGRRPLVWWLAVPGVLGSAVGLFGVTVLGVVGAPGMGLGVLTALGLLTGLAAVIALPQRKVVAAPGAEPDQRDK
jgi:hypothetical protein